MAGPTDLEKRVANIESLLEELRGARIPGGGVTDPAPDEWWRPRWPFPKWPVPPFPFPWPWNPIVDPAPIDWLRNFGGAAVERKAGGVFGPNVDPSPIDLSRMTAIQLQGVKDMITLERKRLDALDSMIGDKIAGLKG